MARAYVELPEGWGPQQAIRADWERGGYRVDLEKAIGAGESFLLVSAAESPARRPGS